MALITYSRELRLKKIIALSLLIVLFLVLALIAITQYLLLKSEVDYWKTLAIGYKMELQPSNDNQFPESYPTDSNTIVDIPDVIAPELNVVTTLEDTQIYIVDRYSQSLQSYFVCPKGFNSFIAPVY